MTLPKYPGTPNALPDHPNANLLANPSEVTPGSSVESPGSGYPDNPAQAPNQSEKIGRGIPATPEYFAQGVQLMSPCHLCGRAYPDTPGMGGIGGPTIYEHIQSDNENPYMREGSDFGSDDLGGLTNDD